MNRPRAVRAATFLLAVHLGALGAEFFAPYDPETQDRRFPYAPPTRVHVLLPDGGGLSWPFVCSSSPRADDPRVYSEDCRVRFPLRFLARGAPYHVGGILKAERRLVDVSQPGRLFLLGTDGFGRDQLSRLLVGARLSLFAGLLAAGLALSVGGLVGGAAGFAGGRTDDVVMRATDLFLAVPWIYLLLAVRAFLPLRLAPSRAFLLVVAVVGIVGWARPARLVRGVALSARRRGFVLAARGFGASDGYLLRRHVLPQAGGVLATYGAVLVPRALLSEVTLSFLGLGVGEPAPSWGTMLAVLQQYHVLVSNWWMFAPGAALVAVAVGYNALASAVAPAGDSVSA